MARNTGGKGVCWAFWATQGERGSKRVWTGVCAQCFSKGSSFQNPGLHACLSIFCIMSFFSYLRGCRSVVECGLSRAPKRVTAWKSMGGLSCTSPSRMKEGRFSPSKWPIVQIRKKQWKKAQECSFHHRHLSNFRNIRIILRKRMQIIISRIADGTRKMLSWGGLVAPWSHLEMGGEEGTISTLDCWLQLSLLQGATCVTFCTSLHMS